VPRGAERAARLSSVLEVIYLRMIKPADSVTGCVAETEVAP
jgi:hypothetical protein